MSVSGDYISASRFSALVCLATAGNAASAVSLWIPILIASRLGSPSDAGVVASSLAVSSPIILFFGFQLRALYVTAASNGSFVSFVKARLWSMAMAFMVVTAIAVCWRTGTTATGAIIAMAGAKAVDAICDIFDARLQRQDRLAAIAACQCFRGVLGGCAFLGAFSNTYDVSLSTAAMGVAWLIGLLVLDIPLALRFPAMAAPKECAQSLRAAIVKEGVPLGATSLFLSLCSTIPSYAIALMAGADALGRYSSCLYLMYGGSLLVVSLGTSMSARINRQFLVGSFAPLMASIRMLLLTTGVLGGITLLTCVFFGEHIVTVIYGERFAGSGRLLAWIAAAHVMVYLASATGFAVTSMRRTTIQLPIVVIAAAASGLSTWALVPTQGAIGGAMSLLCMSVILASGYAVIAARALARAGRQIPAAGGIPLSP